jgi:uncharacterized protein YjdB
MKIGDGAFAAIVAIIICSFAFTGCDSGNNEINTVAVIGVTLDQTELGLMLGDTQILIPTVSPANATNKNVIWLSSATSVVSVDNGTVKAKAIGTATITVITDDGRKKATSTVTVGNVAVSSITLDNPLLELYIGESQLLTPTVLPENAANRSVKWETSDFTKVAVTSAGTVFGVAPGTAIITARTHNNISVSCEVFVVHEAVTDVGLDQTWLTMNAWTMTRLIPTVEPANATIKAVTWSSDKPNVVSVTSNGTIFAVGRGEATITVTTKDRGFQATCEVTVIMPYVPAIDMVWIEPGTFMMGVPVDEEGYWTHTETGLPVEGPQHQVTLTKGFYMGKYEVTQDVYKAVMGVNPSYFNVEARFPNLLPAWPVDNVNWYAAVEFCNRMSAVEGFDPVYTISDRTPVIGYPITRATVTINWVLDEDGEPIEGEYPNGFRLPTEAEWEYACRAETTTPFNFQEHVWNPVTEVYTGAKLPEVWGSDYIWLDWANFDGFYDYNERPTDPDGYYWGQTLPWQYFEDYPNAWGLYNMHGNVEEWCWDWMDYYDEYPIANPGPATTGTMGKYRVLRGGSWNDPAMWVRSGARAGATPQTSYYTIDGNPISAYGFRVVRNSADVGTRLPPAHNSEADVFPPQRGYLIAPIGRTQNPHLIGLGNK